MDGLINEKMLNGKMILLFYTEAMAHTSRMTRLENTQTLYPRITQMSTTSFH